MSLDAWCENNLYSLIIECKMPMTYPGSHQLNFILDRDLSTWHSFTSYNSSSRSSSFPLCSLEPELKSELFWKSLLKGCWNLRQLMCPWKRARRQFRYIPQHLMSLFSVPWRVVQIPSLEPSLTPGDVYHTSMYFYILVRSIHHWWHNPEVSEGNLIVTNARHNRCRINCK